ncbi:MAG: Hg(II)-responsive transcriptional regulator [Gammaproteobacteria bacterium]|nr:MAG: Hg(II)-responsive transcriptional regulator [Gammaproteobacteria bacterium]
MASAGLTIGRLAHEAGVIVETIRYYERRGLIVQPAKPLYGFRHYPSETATRVRFIKRAQRLGFTLREIAELLTLGDGRCENVVELADRKCARIQAQIADLQAMHKALEELICSCRAEHTECPCPIVGSLSEPLSQQGHKT